MRLIDADLLKEQMESVCMGIMAGTDSYNAPLKTIDDAPTIDPVKHGKWKQEWDDLRCCFVYECSACGQPRSGVSEWNYCPTCGARMGGE